MKRSLAAICLMCLLLVSCGGKEAPEDVDNVVSADVSSVSSEAVSDESVVIDDSRDISKDEYIIGSDVSISADVDLEGYVRDDDSFKTVNGYLTVSLYKYNGNAKKLIIPSEIDGKTVDKIHTECFYGSQVEAIYIEDGVEIIGSNAFAKCIKLREIRLPDSLNRIEYRSFAECINLKSIYIPDSIVSIGVDAFRGCISLKSVRLPQTVEYIYSSFTGCTGLVGTAVIPSCGKPVYSVYSGCVGITELIIKDGGQVLKSSVFEGMTGLKTVHIPASVVEFENLDKMFSHCPALEKIYVVDGSYAAYVLADSTWGRYLCSEVEYE